MPYVHDFYFEDIGMIHLATFGSNAIARVKNAAIELRAGKAIILIDDNDRENEGDLIFSTKHLTVQNVNTLIQDCSGIICLCLDQQKADVLGLKPMVTNNQSRYQTAFTVSIEAKHNVSTGVSAQDRWTTIMAAANPAAVADDIVQPGHIFPLVAKAGGVMTRRGHTEGSIDLMEIAQLPPTAVLCELMNKDGSMQKGNDLLNYAKVHQLMILSVEDIYQYKKQMQANTLTTPALAEF